MPAVSGQAARMIWERKGISTRYCECESGTTFWRGGFACSFAFRNLVEDAAIPEVSFLGLLPPAEQLVDGEEFELGKLRGIFLGDGIEARAEVIARGDFLALG